MLESAKIGLKSNQILTDLISTLKSEEDLEKVLVLFWLSSCRKKRKREGRKK